MEVAKILLSRTPHSENSNGVIPLRPTSNHQTRHLGTHERPLQNAAAGRHLAGSMEYPQATLRHTAVIVY